MTSMLYSKVEKVTCLSLMTEIKNNPRTEILTEFAEPKHYMMNVFLNCDIFEEDWKQNSELIKNQAKQIDKMRKRIEELESKEKMESETTNQIQLRPIRSLSLHSLDTDNVTIVNELDDDELDENKNFSKPSTSEKSNKDDKNDRKIFLSGLPDFSLMSLVWQKERVCHEFCWYTFVGKFEIVKIIGVYIQT